MPFVMRETRGIQQHQSPDVQHQHTFAPSLTTPSIVTAPPIPRTVLWHSRTLGPCSSVPAAAHGWRAHSRNQHHASSPVVAIVPSSREIALYSGLWLAMACGVAHQKKRRSYHGKNSRGLRAGKNEASCSQSKRTAGLL